MVTKEKFEIFLKYDGDIDAWARGGKKYEKEIMTDDDWYLIEHLIQDYKIIKSGLASKEYIEMFHKKNQNKDILEMLQKITPR